MTYLSENSQPLIIETIAPTAVADLAITPVAEVRLLILPPATAANHLPLPT